MTDPHIEFRSPWPDPRILDFMGKIAAQNKAARKKGPSDDSVEFDLAGEARELERRVASQIRTQRTSAGMSQAELAAEVSRWGFDMHQTTIAKIEKGDRPLRLGELFAVAFALDIPWLSLVTTGWSARGLPDDFDADTTRPPILAMETYLERLEDSREAALVELKETMQAHMEHYAYMDARAYLAAIFLRAAAVPDSSENDPFEGLGFYVRTRDDG